MALLVVTEVLYPRIATTQVVFVLVVPLQSDQWTPIGLLAWMTTISIVSVVVDVGVGAWVEGLGTAVDATDEGLTASLPLVPRSSERGGSRLDDGASHKAAELATLKEQMQQIARKIARLEASGR